MIMPKIGNHINNLISYVYDKKYGYINELQQTIGEKAVRKLELMGYIENAPHPSGRTWKVTERCKRYGNVRQKKNGLFSVITNKIYAHKLRLSTNS